MAFDWIKLLRERNIDYVTRGASTSRDNVNVKCPLCGDHDTGFHMGISLKGRGWHCWLNQAHSGKSRSKLIQLLLRVDEAAAKEIAGYETAAMPMAGTVGQTLRAKLGGEVIERPKRLDFLPGMYPLMKDSAFAKPFRDWMRKERHYTTAGVEWASETYELRYSISGAFRYRMIIPIHDEKGHLVNWTGRTILKDEDLRYRALGMKPTKTLPPALAQPQQSLLGLSYLWRAPNPKVLVAVEGPMDAIWLTLWGHNFGVYATCLFGLNLSEDQMVLLSALQDRFEQSYLLLDRAASLRSFKLAHSGLRLKPKRLEDHVKDPAELPPDRAQALCLSLL
jgi:hypothetical protein